MLYTLEDCKNSAYDQNMSLITIKIYMKITETSMRYVNMHKQLKRKSQIFLSKVQRNQIERLKQKKQLIQVGRTYFSL